MTLDFQMTRARVAKEDPVPIINIYIIRTSREGRGEGERIREGRKEERGEERGEKKRNREKGG